MRVSDVLRTKGTLVSTVPPDARVSDAVAVLHDMGIGAVVVSADGATIDGILSERDIVRSLHRSDAGAAVDRQVREIMTAEVFTCAPRDRIEDLMSLMTERRIRHLPVTDDGTLVGIVSIGDVVATRLSQLETEARAMEDYIHHGR